METLYKLMRKFKSMAVGPNQSRIQQKQTILSPVTTLHPEKTNSTFSSTSLHQKWK